MQGNNPIRAPLQHDGSVLEVVHIFPTLQGEGPRAGQPAVFVRLGGCNLACHFCDTEFERFSPMALVDVVARVKELAKGTIRLVVITGGEPLRQNIAPLCEALLKEHFAVQIETNGTLWRSLPDAVEVVCSPKNSGQGYVGLRPDVLSRASALKFIISRHDSRYNHVPDMGAHRVPVYVQPMDEYDDRRNAENLAFAAALSRRHGYHLSIQLHKLLGIE